VLAEAAGVLADPERGLDRMLCAAKNSWRRGASSGADGAISSASEAPSQASQTGVQRRQESGFEAMREPGELLRNAFLWLDERGQRP